MIYFCLSRWKAKKCNPSSREEIYCKLSSLSKSGNGRSSLLFPPWAELKFFPSVREGRNTKKIHKILWILSKNKVCSWPLSGAFLIPPVLVVADLNLKKVTNFYTYLIRLFCHSGKTNQLIISSRLELFFYSTRYKNHHNYLEF